MAMVWLWHCECTDCVRMMIGYSSLVMHSVWCRLRQSIFRAVMLPPSCSTCRPNRVEGGIIIDEGISAMIRRVSCAIFLSLTMVLILHFCSHCTVY